MLQYFRARLPRKINVQDHHGRPKSVSEMVGQIEDLNGLLAVAGDVERDG